MLKEIIANQVKMVVDIKNQQLATKTLEVQIGQSTRSKYTRPQGGLPNGPNPNPKQVNAFTTRSGRELEKLVPEKVAQMTIVMEDKINEPKKDVKEECASQCETTSHPSFLQKLNKLKEDVCA